jgi:DNA invertase Pin-like site-specific DNA recombinase
MIVGYARVSSSGQSLDVQLAALAEAGAEKIFSEKQSGSQASNRAALQDALEFVREGDELICVRLDRPPYDLRTTGGEAGKLPLHRSSRDRRYI